MNSSPTAVPSASQAPLTAVGIFLVFASIMALTAAALLIWPGTSLDRLWRLNPVAHHRLAPLGKAVGIPFLGLSALLAFAAVGWFKRRFWGWLLAVGIIAAQLTGDVVNLLLGRYLEGATGILIAGALLLYLLRPKTRAAFLST